MVKLTKKQETAMRNLYGIVTSGDINRFKNFLITENLSIDKIQEANQYMKYLLTKWANESNRLEFMNGLLEMGYTARPQQLLIELKYYIENIGDPFSYIPTLNRLKFILFLITQPNVIWSGVEDYSNDFIKVDIKDPIILNYLADDRLHDELIAILEEINTYVSVSKSKPLIDVLISAGVDVRKLFSQYPQLMKGENSWNRREPMLRLYATLRGNISNSSGSMKKGGRRTIRRRISTRKIRSGGKFKRRTSKK